MAGLKAETLAGIVLAVTNKLAFLEDERVARVTSAETRALDFRLLLAQPVAAYWVLHEADVARLAGLSAVFFTLLLDQLTQERGSVPVTLLLDEFANLGHLPHVATTVTVARGRGIALVLGVQALSQLDGLYGREGADTIRTNCATKVILHGLDYPSAEQVSRLLGEWTVRQEYTSRRPEGLMVTSLSYSEHQTARRLLTADEVRRLRQDELLIVSGNRKPVRTKRWCWQRPPQPAGAKALGPARVQPVALPAAAVSATRGQARTSLLDRLRALEEDYEA
jgi:type IV secretion system protein VirD4